MIESFNNIETGFKKLKLFVWAITIASTLISISAIICSFIYAEQQRHKIYVLDEGKSLLLALQSDKVANVELEIKDHVTRFHELFFNLSPSADAIKYSIERALKLSNQSAYTYYKDLQERGYFNRLIQNNISQSIRIDSIAISNSYPYKITTYAKLYILRSSSLTEQQMITKCDVIDIARSDANPHGLMIEKFEVIENKTTREEKR